MRSARHIALATIIALSSIAVAAVEPNHVFDIRAFGAIGSGTDKCTDAINQAIEACAKHGGGTVLVPGGTYLTGSIELLSHVTLHLDAGAVLKGSEDLADYGQGRGRAPLIRATNAENIAIIGRGAIDGSGTTFMDMTKTRTGPYLPKDLDPNVTRQGRDYMDAKFGETDGPVVYRSRPNRLIRFTHCKNVLVRDVRLRNAPTWTLHLDDCEDATITGIGVHNNLLVPNSDGIHCTSCRRVRISDCDISAGDDAIAITTLDNPPDRICEGIVVTNCILQSRSAGIRVGYGNGLIRDCTFQNVTIRESNRGLGLFVRDGGAIQNILFSNITIRTRLHTGHWWGNAEPIHLSVIPQKKDAPAGTIRRVIFSNILAESESGIVVWGAKPGDISDLSFDNVRLSISNSPLNAAYGGNFDLRPAYDHRFAIFRHDIPAIYCRHVDGCRITGLGVTWQTGLPDFFNHAICCEQVTRLTIDAFEGRQPHLDDPRAAIALNDARRVTIRNCTAAEGTGTFLSCRASEGTGLFVNNDVRRARKAIEPGEDGFTLDANLMPPR